MKPEYPREDALEQLDKIVTEKIAVSGHCAQSSFAALNEQFQLGGGSTLKALTPLPGIALRGETCGALIGCLMALGLVYGRDELDDAGAFLASIPPARQFCRIFEEEVGSTQCRQILEIELGTRLDLAKRADFADYLRSGGPQKCSEVIRAGVRIAAEIIMPDGEQKDDPGVMLTV